MVLVEYACTYCSHRTERWTRPEIPATTSCPGCGGTARRRFGGTLLGSAPAAPAPRSPASHCAGTPGDCVLTPTAARMLDSRIRGDRRAIERETAFQERAISDGTLDPSCAPVSGPS